MHFPGGLFNGRITYIAPQGNEEHNYPVEITIDNGVSSKRVRS